MRHVYYLIQRRDTSTQNVEYVYYTLKDYEMHFFASCGGHADAPRRHTPSRSPRRRRRRRAMAPSSSSSTLSSTSSSLHAPDFAYTHDARAVRAAVRAAVHRASADTMSLRTLERASDGGYSTRMDVVTIALGGLDASRARDDGLRVVLVRDDASRGERARAGRRDETDGMRGLTT